MGKVFISYAMGGDGPVAQALSAHLKKRGIETWIAPDDVPTGTSHVDVIPEALADATAVVVLYSDATNSAPYVKLELDQAVTLGLRLIPVRLDDAPPNRGIRYLLGGSQWINAYEQPTDIWREQVVQAILNPGVAATGSAARKSWPSIPLDPNVFLLAAVTLIATLALALFMAATAASETKCFPSFRLACATDPKLLAAVFLILVGLCVFLPRTLKRRRRYLVLEFRDAITLLTVSSLILFGVFFRLWLAVLLVVCYLLIYPLIRRKFDGRRAIVSIVALLIGVASASFGEGAFYRGLMSGANNALLLFNQHRTIQDYSNEAALRIYGLFLEGIAGAEGSVSAQPHTLPNVDEFWRNYRTVNVHKELGPLFERAVLQLQPFDIVLVVDAVGAKEVCGVNESRLSIRAQAFDYALGRIPNWAEGAASTPAKWKDFEILVEQNPAGDAINSGDVRALFVAHLVDWLLREPNRVAQDAAKLKATAFDDLYFQIVGRDGKCDDADAASTVRLLCNARGKDIDTKYDAVKKVLDQRPKEIEPNGCAKKQQDSRSLADSVIVQTGK
jgi:hypothetical protein